MWYVLKYMCVYFKKLAMALICMLIMKMRVYMECFSN